MAAAAVGVLALMGACDNGPSAVETRDRASTVAEGALTAATGATSAEAATLEAARPAVTTNRRETADAKVARLFERNGAAFGARSADDYLGKMRTFTGSPPAGTETARRPNGDTLYYQASTNTFAVVARNGAPRTMFKPDDGPTYWAQQKERAPTFGQRKASE